MRIGREIQRDTDAGAKRGDAATSGPPVGLKTEGPLFCEGAARRRSEKKSPRCPGK